MTAPAGWAEMGLGGIDTQRHALDQSPAADAQLLPPSSDGACQGPAEPREQRPPSCLWRRPKEFEGTNRKSASIQRGGHPLRAATSGWRRARSRTIGPCVRAPRLAARRCSFGLSKHHHLMSRGA
jgi:hypothetical protein